MDPIPGSLQALLGVSDNNSESCSLFLDGGFGSSKDKVNCFTVDELGKHVFSGGNDGTVRVYDSETRECVHVLRGHSAPVVNVVSLDHGRLVSASQGDGTLRLWNVDTGEELKQVSVTKPKNVTRLTSDTIIMTEWLLRRGRTFTKIQFHQNDELTMRRRRVVGNSLSIQTMGVLGFTMSFSFSSISGSVSTSDGKIAAVCVDNMSASVLRVWDSQSMNCLHEENVWPGGQTNLALNAKYLVRTSLRSLVLHDVVSMEELFRVRLPFMPRSVRFTHDGNFVATLGRRQVLFHSVTNGRLVCRAGFDATAPPVSSRFVLLPDNRILFTPTRGSNDIQRYQIIPQVPDDTIGESDEDGTERDVLPPLQAGLLAVMQGSVSAGDQCAALISRERCEVSLSEWYAAHQLLVIAVTEGTVRRSPHFHIKL